MVFCGGGQGAFSSRIDKFKVRRVFPLALPKVGEATPTHSFGMLSQIADLSYKATSVRQIYVLLYPLQRAWQELANKGCKLGAPRTAYQLLDRLRAYCDFS